jgi:S-adenosylmethionine hydrolase
MQIVTLLSDLGTKDYALSVWKASIYSSFSDVQVVDITHQVDAYNLIEAFYIFSNAYKNFPKNTIHLIGIDVSFQKGSKIILAKKNHHFFISIDNGFLSLLEEDTEFEWKKEKIITEFDDFILKNSYLSIVDLILNNEEELLKLDNCVVQKELKLPKPIFKEEVHTIIGSVIYVDRFGNAITNITLDFFATYFKDKKIIINANHRFISKINNYYNEIVENSTNYLMKFGEMLAVFNENNYLEIAIYKGNPKTVGGANTLLGLYVGTEIKITLK